MAARWLTWDFNQPRPHTNAFLMTALSLSLAPWTPAPCQFPLLLRVVPSQKDVVLSHLSHGCLAGPRNRRSWERWGVQSQGKAAEDKVCWGEVWTRTEGSAGAL